VRDVSRHALDEREAPMLEARGGTTIAVPAEQAYDFVADARNEPQWLPGAADVRLTSSAPVGAGSTFVGTYARAGEVRLEITEFERPLRLTIHGDAKGMSFDDRITFTPTGDGVTLEAVMSTQPRGVFRLFAPMMGRVIERQFQGNWDRLRQRLET
jgi:uncharacterized protein YndB with AHSA1/START domain